MVKDANGNERQFQPPLVKCDYCQVEAIRDLWMKWGGVCPECMKQKQSLY
jgi:hypothetical protein